MKIRTRSPHILHLRQLLGLALIGFVLWLAAIGWLLITPAQAAPGGARHDTPEKKAGVHAGATEPDARTCRPDLTNPGRASKLSALERMAL